MFSVNKQVAEPTEGVKISIPVSALAWARKIGEAAERTEKEVLTEAVLYAKKTHETRSISLAIPDDLRRNLEVSAIKLGTTFEGAILDLLRPAAAKAASKLAKKPEGETK